MSGFTIDPQDLNSFASGVRDLITNLNSAKSQADPQVAVPPVKFGQDATYPASLHPAFPPAVMLRGQLQQHLTDFGDNFKTLISELTILADTADAIAKNYTDAAAIDGLSAGAVNAMLNSAGTSGNGTPGTGT
jgi:hypothetical protein